MDATTKQKTLSFALAALMVGSVFAALAVPAAAQTMPTSITGAPVRVVDATTNTVILPSGSTIEFNQTYDLNVTRLSASGNYALYTPAGALASNPQPALQNGTGTWNVTFPGQLFNALGNWKVQLVTGTPPADDSTLGTAEATVPVTARTALTITMTPDSFAYSPTASQVVTITATYENGTAVPFAQISGPGIQAGAQTLAGGSATITLANVPSAGRHTVTVTKDLNGDGSAELRGTTNFTVTPLGIAVNPVATTVRSGFAETASWYLNYTDGGVFATTGSALTRPVVRANLSVTLPDGSVNFYNASSATGGAGPCGGFVGFDASIPTTDIGNYSGGECRALGAVSSEQPAWEFDSNGLFSFRPNATWLAGTYSFNLVVDRADVDGAQQTAGATSLTPSAPEYTAAWSITTQAPQSVNLIVRRDSTTGPTLSNLTVQSPTSVTTGRVPGAYTVVLEIRGEQLGITPTLAEGFSAENITVSGDIVPRPEYVTYAGGAFVTISDLVPTKAGGQVTFTVNWKGTNTTVSLPIVGGAIGSANEQTIRVDQNTPVTINVQDMNGNPQSAAQIFVFRNRTDETGATRTNGQYPGLENFAVIGSGNATAGAGGNYVLNLRPTVVGNLVIAAVIGGSGAENWTYIPLQVVPNADLNVTSSVNQTMAGLRTQFVINATMPDGTAITGTPGATSGFNVFFLKPSDVANLTANGTVPATAATGGQVTIGGVTATGIVLNASLLAGEYSIYVCSNLTSAATTCSTATHDNRGNMPNVTVSPYQATFTPDQIANTADVQSDVTITVRIVDADGNPANGTLRPVTGTSSIATGVPATVNIVNGNGTMTGITGTSTGNLSFEFDPTETTGATTFFAPIPEVVQVTGPNLIISPDSIPLTGGLVSVTVQNYTGAPLPGRVIRICGIGLNANFPSTFPATLSATDQSNCPDVGTTDADGNTAILLTPRSAGQVRVYVNNTWSGRVVNITIGALSLAIDPASPTTNGTANVTVTAGGSPVPSANVTVTRDNTTVVNTRTDVEGRVVLTNLEAGNYTVTATRNGYTTATRTFRVADQPVQEPTEDAEFVLSNLQTPSTGTVGSGLTVTADVENTGSADGTATVLLLVNGAVRDSQSVPVSAGETQTVGFDFTPNTAGSYSVTVRLAGGETLAERTVTVTTPTQPTQQQPTQQQPTQTTPTQTNPTPTTQASPEGVPGFEFVALIGALGAALLVLRRRN